MAINPQPLTQIDTFTGVATGVTATGLSNSLRAYPIRVMSIRVLGTGAPATSWDVRLEGSVDGITFEEVRAHTTSTGDGTIAPSGILTESLVYFRSRVNTLTLGPATNIVVTIVAEQTVPVSIPEVLALPVGAATQATLASIDTKTPTLVSGRQPVDGSGVTQPTSQTAANGPVAVLAVTNTGASGAAVTATLPAVAGQFHYITYLEIIRFNTAAVVATTVPILVTTTNLPGAMVFTLARAGTAGLTEVRQMASAMPLKSSVVNTATTIVCPAVTSIIWRVNVWYQAAP